ncbi:MAG: hypothetical protein LBO79_04385 [Zoogloeaceae bacterium]|jgi:hypothetical protein|nr:hypothetical protein [Zoogloeaceae bacterium]
MRGASCWKKKTRDPNSFGILYDFVLMPFLHEPPLGKRGLVSMQNTRPMDVTQQVMLDGICPFLFRCHGYSGVCTETAGRKWEGCVLFPIPAIMRPVLKLGK